jgi:hypothetical protein
MQLLVSALSVLFAVVLALWPIAFLAALVHHTFSRQWQRAGRLSLLLPLWILAVLICVAQSSPVLPESDELPQASSLVAGIGVVLAACCAATAWWLLIRSFRIQQLPAQDKPSAA